MSLSSWWNTLIKIGFQELVWLCWISIDIESKGNPWMPDISMERNMLIAEKFLSKNAEMSMANIHGINIDGGTCWYPPPTCQFLKLQHHTSLFCLWEKHHYWKTVQYIKDRTTEWCFEDYFPHCKRKPKYKLKHMINWFSLFIYFHNKEISVKWTGPIIIV